MWSQIHLKSGGVDSKDQCRPDHTLLINIAASWKRADDLHSADMHLLSLLGVSAFNMQPSDQTSLCAEVSQEHTLFLSPFIIVCQVTFRGHSERAALNQITPIWVDASTQADVLTITLFNAAVPTPVGRCVVPVGDLFAVTAEAKSVAELKLQLLSTSELAAGTSAIQQQPVQIKFSLEPLSAVREAVIPLILNEFSAAGAFLNFLLALLVDSVSDAAQWFGFDAVLALNSSLVTQLVGRSALIVVFVLRRILGFPKTNLLHGRVLRIGKMACSVARTA